MGRNKTCIYLTTEAISLSMKDLVKGGLIEKGTEISGYVKFYNGDTIGIESTYIRSNMSFTFFYSITSNKTGVSDSFEYEVQIDTVPSNLGQGDVLYFIDPAGYRCRKLYMAYGSQKFYSRQYYESIGCRLYYPCQAECKEGYLFNRMHHYDRLLTKLYSNNKRKHYQGNRTRKQVQIAMAEKKSRYYTRICNEIFERKIHTGCG